MVSVFYQILYWLKDLTGLILTVAEKRQKHQNFLPYGIKENVGIILNLMANSNFSYIFVTGFGKTHQLRARIII